MIRRRWTRLVSFSPIEPQRLCPRYRRREIQYGARKGNGFGGEFRSRNRYGGADAISGSAAACDVRLRRKWTSAFVDGTGLCWTRRAHISLVGLSAELDHGARAGKRRAPKST